MNVFTELNYLSILFAVVAGQGLEILWFSKGMFGYYWSKDVGLSPEEMSKRDNRYGFLSGLILSLCTAFLLSVLIHAEQGTSAFEGMLLGLLAASFVAVAQGVNFIYESRPVRFYLIMVGYPLVAYPIMGLIIGYWM